MHPGPLRIFVTVTLLAITTLSFGQTHLSAAFKKSLYDADQLYEDGQFIRALSIYDSLWDIQTNDVYLQYRTGVCHIYLTNGREKAYDILKGIVGIEGYDDVTFYLARAKHLNYQFEDAIDLYNDYLTTYRPSGTQRIMTLHYISNCKAGIELMKRRMALNLEILTPPSNNQNSQYSPVISPDGLRLYYANRGPESKGELMDSKSKKSATGTYYEDVFVATRNSDDADAAFSDGRNISDNINKSDRHEAPMSISYDNKLLFLYLSGEKESEDIYISENLNDTGWTKPVKADGINTPQWEGHACLAPDGKTLYFTSDRPGGYGGRDIYVATRKDNGSFEDVVNIGPKINTPFNEDAPFIFADGSSLYFASEAHGSMGGYDIFYIKFDSNTNQWQEPVNMGYPLNTTDDDSYYYISHDGEWGYFSSARASGENLHDIYRINPGTYERLHDLVLLVSNVYIDEQPSSALIKIMDDKTGDVLTTLFSDSLTGEFVYSLLPGQKYKISLLADGFPPKLEYVEIPYLSEGALRVEHNFDFYTEGFLASRDSVNLQSQIEGLAYDGRNGGNGSGVGGTGGDDSSAIGKKSGPDQFGVCHVEKERESLTEEEIAAGCYFRVQVGAYRNPGKFKYEFLRSLGNVEIKSSADDITRYLMGQKFTKRSEAEELRLKCVEAGQWDAWITVRR